MATSNSSEGYLSVRHRYFAPIGKDKFGGEYGAVKARG